MIHWTSIQEEEDYSSANWTTGLLVVVPIPIPDVVVVIRQETLLLIQRLKETIRKEHAHVPRQIL